ncbi:MAG: GNAT family N-acetyltransferase [Lachnospiraceae bacterium]|nr:GNAT family N-acetyltransferase [Lachnospiraceae bacterium]
MEDVIIRPLKDSEKEILKEFLYEAIFVPEGEEPPEKNIINREELMVYLYAFGRGKADFALVAEIDEKIIGAVWTRIMNDYGHVDDETPSFAISLYKEYRSQGIGTRLMQEMLQILKDKGYQKASLAVQKANYAVRMYKKLGFQVFRESEEEYIMICDLTQI